MSRWTGRTLSKVEIQGVLSRGGMAEIYVGRHTTLDRPVAVKVLFSHLNSDADLLERFTREARAVAALRHPNIVQVYDFDVADDLPYIVMELLQGIALSDYLARLREEGRTLPLDTTARLAHGMAAALDYAHGRGIVHRDIKPSNVFLRYDTAASLATARAGEPLPAGVEPVLLDFGVMRLAESDSTRTAAGTVIGTPTYMSPEQAEGTEVDSRSDVYSFGVMLYEMISGKPPFDPDSFTPTSLLIKHITAPPPPLPNASPELQAVLARALAKKPEERYQRAGELAADLGKAIVQTGERDLASMPTRVSRPAGVPSPAELPTTHTEPPPVYDHPQSVDASKATTVTSPVRAGAADVSSPAAAEAKVSRGPLYLTIGLTAALLIAAAFMFNPFASSGSDSAANVTPAAAAGSQGGTPTQVSPTAAGTAAAGTAAAGAASSGQNAGNLRFFDLSNKLDEMVLTASSFAQPPDGTQYEAWLLGEGGEIRQSMGVFNVKADGTGELTFSDPEGANLLARFDSFEITAEPKGETNPLPTGQVVYNDALPQGALVHLRHLLVAFPSTVDQTSLCGGLLDQTKRLNDLAQALLGAQQEGDLARMKRDAEAIVNLIEGANGEHFGDIDSDGFTDNPGDGFGLLLNGRNIGYIQGTFEHARNTINSPDATDNIKLHASHVMTAAGNLGEWAAQVRDLSLPIATADSTSSAAAGVRQVLSMVDRMLNGKDLNGNERIDPIPGEAGAKLAYEHALYMNDMFAYPSSGPGARVLPPQSRTPMPTESYP